MLNKMTVLRVGVPVVICWAASNFGWPCPTPPVADAKAFYSWWTHRKVEYAPEGEAVHFSAVCEAGTPYDYSYDPDNVNPATGHYPYPWLGITNGKWEYSKDGGPWYTFADSPTASSAEYTFTQIGVYTVRVTVTDDDSQQFGGSEPNKTASDTCTVHVFKVSSVVWYELHSPLDENPNFGGGKRIFPCKGSP